MAIRGGGGEARYGIKLESNAKEVGAEGASALEQFRDKITASKDAIRGMSESLRALKGNSDEVKKTREQLTNALKAEQNAMSQNTLAIVKAGSSYTALAKSQKAAADSAKQNADAMNKSISAAGGPVQELKSKWGELSEALSTSEGAAALASGALVAGAAAAALAVVGLAAAVAAGVVAFGAWVVGAGNVLRTQQLTREAFTGNEEDAKRLGNQIETLGKKVPTTRAELNNLGDELLRNGLRGQAMVDALNAAAQAQSALGGSAGKQVSDLIERGKLMGRFSLGRLDTQGLGIQFGDVAASLAKNMKTSIAEASTALMQGQVTLGDGAQAMRDAIEKRFAGVNLAKMLDWDVMKTKFGEALEALTKDIDLEPLLADVKGLFSLADTSTQSGSGLKDLVTWIGQGLVDAVHTAAPMAKSFFEGMVLQGLKLEIAWLDLRIQWQETFGDDSLDDLIDFADAGAMLSKVFGGVWEAVHLAGGALKVFRDARDDVEELEGKAAKLYKAWKAIPWGDIGASILDGIVGPMRKMVSSVEELQDDTIGAIKKKWGINSPSKVMQEIEENKGKGTIAGQDKMRDAVADAVDRNAPDVAGGGGAGASARGAAALPPFHLTLEYSGPAGRDDAQALGEAVLAKLIDGIEIYARQRGLVTT